MSIHPTAIVAKSAQIGRDVEIGPYAIVEEGAQIGRSCRLAAHAILRAHSILGKSVRMDSFAVVGGEPQVLGFDPSVHSRAEIGEGCVLREGVTVSRSTQDQRATRVGPHCFLMANSHVAHDAELGHHVTLANGVLLAGHVRIGDYCFFGGGSLLHQYCRVGEGAMIGGGTALSADVPAFTIAARHGRLYGLNLVGMRRRNFTSEEMHDIKICYYHTFQAGDGSPARIATEALEHEEFGKTAPGRRFLEFLVESDRGYTRTAIR